MSEFGEEKTIFHRDNARVRSYLVAMTKLQLGYEILPYPPYLPELAHSDYFLQKRWTKLIEMKGDNVVKYNKLCT